LFSTMSPAASFLERLSPEFLTRARSAGVTLGVGARKEEGLAFGVGWPAEIPGIPRGQVTELLGYTGGQRTTLALRACAAAQNPESEQSQKRLCAFVDPTSSLYAPGVWALGVELSRLLVVRPCPEALSAVTLKLVRSRIFGLIVIDTVGVPSQPVSVDWGAWVRVVRQMNLALEGTASSVLLLTDAKLHRPLPLPVARRLELGRPNSSTLRLRVVRDRHQGPSSWQSVPYESPTFDQSWKRSA
jgi:recombination protein RecA